MTSNHDTEMRHIETNEASQMEASQCASTLDVDIATGLTAQDVHTRREMFGDNELKGEESESMLSRFLDQLKDPMILLLLSSAAISILLGQWDDAFSITLAISLVSTVAVIQEYKSDQTLAALSTLAPPKCTVRRDGRIAQITAAELVPGDIVVMRVGDRVPADLRILMAHHLKVDESSLTGETEPCDKSSHAMRNEDADAPLAERTNMAFLGTLVRTGRGEGIVTSTGHQTELGKMYDIVQSATDRKSPLQLRMDALGKQLSAVSIGIIGVIVLIGVIQKRNLLEMFTIGVSLAVAAIPEGLPIVVTVTLALGVQRMASRKAVVKRLTAVEALGCASVVCADKTGTLTRNEMTAVEVYTLAPPKSNGTTTDMGNDTDDTTDSNLLPSHSVVKNSSNYIQQRRKRYEKMGSIVALSGQGYESTRGIAQIGDVMVDVATHPQIAVAFEIGAVCNDAQLAGGGNDELYHSEHEGFGTNVPTNEVSDENTRLLTINAPTNPSRTAQTSCQLVSGQPTEAALLVAARKMGLHKVRHQYKRTLEIPFTHERKWMAVRVAPKPRDTQPNNPSTPFVTALASPTPTVDLNIDRTCINTSTDDLMHKNTQNGSSDIKKINSQTYDVSTGWPAMPGELYFVKGSIEMVLPMCGRYVGRDRRFSTQPEEFTNTMGLSSDCVWPMNREKRDTILFHAQRMAREGLRVLAMATGDTIPPCTSTQYGSETPSARDIEKTKEHDQMLCEPNFPTNHPGLVFAGLVGLHDPPRESVHESISILKRSGVRVAMITGDSEATAVAVATHLGLTNDGRRHPSPTSSMPIIDETGNPVLRGRADSTMSQWLAESEVDVEAAEADGSVISGREIDKMTDAELARRLKKVCVFYRTTPKHKMKIVRAYQESGEIVGMTGDGVNDAPALKAADIGVAMGEAGTEVAKQAADVVLLDDNFATILTAVEEGKGIFFNIRNFVRFQLSTSVAALSIVALATLFGYPNPLNAMQILWINIIMDGPPAQSLGVEPVHPDVMKHPPRHKDEPIITRSLLARVLVSGILVVLGTMYMFLHELGDAEEVSRRTTTVTFTTFVLFDMFNALSCRSIDKSVFELGFFTNSFFFYAVGGSLVGQLFVIYFPPLQAIFQTEALTMMDWIKILAITSTAWLWEEMIKACLRQMDQSTEMSSNHTIGTDTRSTAVAYARGHGIWTWMLHQLRRIFPRSTVISKRRTTGHGISPAVYRYPDNTHANGVTLSESQRSRAFYSPLPPNGGTL